MDMSLSELDFLDEEFNVYLQNINNDLPPLLNFNNLEENSIITTPLASTENDLGEDYQTTDFSYYELQPPNVLKVQDNLPEIDDTNIYQNENVVQDSKVTQKRRKTRQKITKKMEIKISREACSSGLQYVNTKGEVVPEKIMGPPCRCRSSCYTIFDEDTRKNLFNEFWKTFDWQQRSQYIAILVIETPKKRSRSRKVVPTNRRQSTYKYTLLKNGDFIKVCRNMFLNTFSLSDKFVRWSMIKKRLSPNGIIGPDKFGKYSAKVKKSKEVVEMVRDHIKSFSTVVMENADNEGVRMFLDSSLNIARMYKLYVKQCQYKGMPEVDIVNENYYRRIFKTEFNISFKNSSRNGILENQDQSSNSSC